MLNTAERTLSTCFQLKGWLQQGKTGVETKPPTAQGTAAYSQCKIPSQVVAMHCMDSDNKHCKGLTLPLNQISFRSSAKEMYQALAAV